MHCGRKADGLRLTPHYDLVSPEVYAGLERSMAMKIGGAWDIRNIQKADWKRFANQTRLRWDAVRATLLGLADDVENSVEGVENVCYKELRDDQTYSQIRQVITRHIEQIRRELI